MLLAMDTMVAEEVGVFMARVVSEDVEEGADKVEEDMTKEVVEYTAEHMKM